MRKNQQSKERVDDLQRSGSKLTLPALCDSKCLALNMPQLQRDQVLKLDELFYSLQGNNIARVPMAFRNSMGHLTSRQVEVIGWQTLIYEALQRVEREITCVEQMKDLAEHCLQERQLYSQLLSDCLALSNSLSSAGLRQDQVIIKLKKEEQMTNESKDLLQKQICILLDKLNSLKMIHSQLLMDCQDKSETIRLTTKCLTFELETPCIYSSAGPLKPTHVSYEKWLSHCQNLKVTSDNLIKDSSSCRGNLRFLLANLRNSYERQRCTTKESLRRKIHELTKLNDTLNRDKQRIKHEISDLTKDVQRMLSHINNFENRMHQTTHLLDILNQRRRFELCLDQPHKSLTLERQDLAKMSSGLQLVLQLSQQNLGMAHRHLIFVEDKLARNAQTMEVAQRCQSLHQSFQLAIDTAVILSNKPTLYKCVESSCHNTNLE
ncbi:tektin-2-like [Anableps anableps]